MKATDVPQEEETIFAGHQRACYATDDQGRYVVVGSIGWEVEKTVNDQANELVREQIAAALARVRRGEVSVLAYHMARRQMSIGMLAAYSGVSRLRIHWHLRPNVYARLPEEILNLYVAALQLPAAELRSLPAEADCERL
jgi:hypothetical protein